MWHVSSRRPAPSLIWRSNRSVRAVCSGSYAHRFRHELYGIILYNFRHIPPVLKRYRE